MQPAVRSIVYTDITALLKTPRIILVFLLVV